MEKNKSLYDISWQVPEEEYRKDHALSYSTLSRYEKEGFSNLYKLFDKVESPSLTLGSAVDAWITGGYEEFEKNFIVADFPKISDSLVATVRKLFSKYSNMYGNFADIPDSVVSSTAKQCDFWVGDKWDKIRPKKVKEEQGCHDYYHLMFSANGKSILTSETYNDVCNMVSALKNNDATKYYFAPNNPFDDTIERLYQLKFKATLEDVDYRCMADLVLTNTTDKTVQPLDLKTSGHQEYMFADSFIKWGYSIQARLYWRIIRDNMDKDPYFKDFELLDYKFIVVNRVNLDPMVWTFPNTKTVGTLTYGKNNQIVCRDPFEIGKELSGYLSSRPKRPNGIKDDNNLVDFLNNL